METPIWELTRSQSNTKMKSKARALRAIAT